MRQNIETSIDEEIFEFLLIRNKKRKQNVIKSKRSIQLPIKKQ